MKNTPVYVAALALLSLTACESKPEEVSSTAPDPMASQLANAAPVELPPAISSTATLRCGDNSLVFVDFFQGNKQVQLRTEKGGKATMLKAAAEGGPFEADGGYKLTGTPKSVNVTLPGKGSKTCHV
ncbi:MAG: hypothetical protein J7500_17885 [Sphingomonas sp.]|uniref:hypothetical protein n=1 Tax=Sphingomonas sp. TaxID=28214 RepID=UPI001B2AE4A1|nr:hypothetical protein [Sphingomonas sp.]MBO9624581.1 hypothetical protein [Sphingomonas sp.]